MESYLNFLDPPAFITPEDLSLTDGELFPSDMDPYTRDRTSHMRQHLSWIEDHAKGYYFPSPSYPSNVHVNEPFSAYNAGCLSAESTMNFQPPAGASSIAYSHSDRFLSPPPCTGHPSSTSGLDSPRSSNLGDIGCYPSYACDEVMSPSIENWSYPSPQDLTTAPPKVLWTEPDNSVMHDLFIGNETFPPLGSGKLWSDRVENDKPVQQDPSVSEKTPAASEIPTQDLTDSRARTSRKLTNSRAPRGGVHKTNCRSRPLDLLCCRKPRSTPVKADKVIITGGRQFICSFAHYGCTSTFSSKNEWKRHITSQHLQLGFYRCDIGNCNMHQRSSSVDHPKRIRSTSHRATNSTNTNNLQVKDFNRKDLFIQHLRRMHAPWNQPDNRYEPSAKERDAFEQNLGDISQRCWHQRRQPPQQSQCGFCNRVFQGENSWNEHMEHVGKHLERDEKLPEVKAEDVRLRKWAIQEGIIRKDGEGWVLSSHVK